MTLLKKDLGDADRFAEIYTALISNDREDMIQRNLNLVRRECPVAALGTLKGQRTVSVLPGTVRSGSTGKFDIELSDRLTRTDESHPLIVLNRSEMRGYRTTTSSVAADSSAAKQAATAARESVGGTISGARSSATHRRK